MIKKVTIFRIIILLDLSTNTYRHRIIWLDFYLNRKNTMDCRYEGVLEKREDGGPDRNRTGVRGFAGRCITTLPPGLNAL